MEIVSTPRVRAWTYLPLIIAFGYVPLIVRGCFYVRPVLNSQIWFPDTSYYDFFLVYKSYLILICAALALIFFIFFPKFKIFKDRIWIPLLIFAVFALFSGILSPYKSLVFTGSFEMMEGLPIIFSYLILALYGYYRISLDGLRGIRILITYSIPGILIILLIGFFQFFGLDFYSTEIGLAVIAGPDFSDLIGSFASDPINPVFSTLYNADNAAIYFLMIAGLTTPLIFAVRKLFERIILIIVAALSILDIFFTSTLTGVLVLLALGIITLLIFAYKNIKRGLLATLGCVVLVLIVGFIGLRSDRIRQEAGFESTNDYPVSRIITDTDKVWFMFPTDQLQIISNPDGSFTARDSRGDVIFRQYFDESGNTYYGTENISSANACVIHSISREADGTRFTVALEYSDGKTGAWEFVKKGNYGPYLYINSAGKETPFPGDIIRAYTFPDRLFNNRGLIWNYTLPTLSKHILFGSGANTYVMVYPQEDYLTETYLNLRQIDVKPHSFYLQQWSDHGLIALIALVVFFIWALVRSLRNLRRNSLREPMNLVALGLTLGVFAQLISGLAQDSNVCSSPVFWVIIGCINGLHSHRKKPDN